MYAAGLAARDRGSWGHLVATVGTACTRSTSSATARPRALPRSCSLRRCSSAGLAGA